MSFSFRNEEFRNPFVPVLKSANSWTPSTPKQVKRERLKNWTFHRLPFDFFLLVFLFGFEDPFESALAGFFQEPVSLGWSVFAAGLGSSNRSATPQALEAMM